MPAPVTLYGIPNCDQVKRARVWLAQAGIEYVFHDFKKHGVERSTIDHWLQRIDWETLLNRRGTTWRGLSEARRQAVNDADSAGALMLEATSVIKRPVLVTATHCICGFDSDLYQQMFK